MHQTDCEPVLEKMGIEYSPEDKFKLTIGKKSVVGRPLVNS
jgi:hypothetical protein